MHATILYSIAVGWKPVVFKVDKFFLKNSQA